MPLDAMPAMSPAYPEPDTEDVLDIDSIPDLTTCIGGGRMGALPVDRQTQMCGSAWAPGADWQTPAVPGDAAPHPWSFGGTG
eukprot:CAMPEP_0176334770 /NCGR_PEP_ID=MMETSP0121_2-20121125/78271_1 /TAXON_ID=160619 /ORGANISM="Kryptoperidinium foliaceum, Strain CCMP 1326" /LENGTH=81 /DNA_ID=CAMNT_0017677725 /DNA_START=1 /DNA_END=242 /DNA_ORIENTATION=+